MDPTACGAAAVEALGRLWQADGSSDVCPGCGDAFSVFSRRHHCRCCGRLACDCCTASTWEARALPLHCRRGGSGSSGFRVCHDCVRDSEALKAALRSGELEPFGRLMAASVVARALVMRDLPLPGERGRRSAHVVAQAGSLPLLRHLRSAYRVTMTAVDDRGRTPFAVAAAKPSLHVMRWLALCVGSRAAEVACVDTRALCRAFDAGILGVAPWKDGAARGKSVSSASGGFAPDGDDPPHQSADGYDATIVDHDAATSDSCGSDGGAAAPTSPLRGPPVTPGRHGLALDSGSSTFEVSTCLVCWERPACFCFVPCGHVVACSVCVDELETHHCPYCRAPVERRIKAYFPSV
uniref:RING-type domain-containing protein n=2 Tax=Bicosoecida sp. CB-2014 TaxID=1486930 RepID=A0A7S1CAA7_9STRA|mmetsp:Transcript_19348/g.68437  ORF Transcript_19348/g.68437 Transcript_19348/m.68437 type:complete len:352 (+) Transcript_19348:184-1239(+)